MGPCRGQSTAPVTSLQFLETAVQKLGPSQGKKLLARGAQKLLQGMKKLILVVLRRCRLILQTLDSLAFGCNILLGRPPEAVTKGSNIDYAVSGNLASGQMAPTNTSKSQQFRSKVYVRVGQIRPTLHVSATFEPDVTPTLVSIHRPGGSFEHLLGM